MSRTTANVGSPGFVVDHQSMRLNSGRQIDWDHVGEIFRTTPGTPPVTVVVGAAGASADATSVPVAALSAAIPSGTTLDFGTNKFARLTADAAAGATSLTTAAIPKALVSGDTATYAGTVGSGPKVLKAGTVVGEALGSGKVSPRVASTNPATGILVTTAIEDDRSAAISGYGVYVGGVVYESLLPDASGSPRTLASGIKTEFATALCTFQFEAYADDSAS